jgi:4-carboxymuconolactone decarboxylase
MTVKVNVSDRYKRGRRKLKSIHGQRGIDTIDSLGEIAPDMARFVYEFPFAEIYTRPGLDIVKRQFVTLSILATLGNTEPQLKAHIRGSLNVGIKREEIIEAFMQLAVYAGFPASLNALRITRDVFRELDQHAGPGKTKRKRS